MLGTRLLRRGVTLGAGLSLSSVAVASVPAKLVSLTVSRIATDAMPAHVLSLASIGVPPMTLFKSATALLAGLLVVGVAFGPMAAGEPPKAQLPVPAKKPADPPEPEDPEPEVVKGYHQVSASAYSRDGKRLAIVRSDTKEVKVYDTATWKVTHTLDGLKVLAFAVQFSPDGMSLYAAAMDGPIHTWDLKTDKAGKQLDAKAGPCYGLVLSPDGKTLASGHHDTEAGKSAIHLWDAATGKAGRAITPAEALLPNTLTFSPDGKTVAGAYHATHKKKPDADGFHGVIEWDATTGKEVRRLETPRITGGAIPIAHAIAYTPDGKKLILGGGEAVLIPGGKGSSMLYGYLWVIDRKSGEVENTLVANRSDYIRTLAMSPDGGKLYVPAGRLAARAIPRGAPPNPPYEFQCWDTSTWEVSWSVSSLTPRGVTNVAVSPDGKRLGLTGMDGFHLHDAKTGEAKGGLVEYVRPR
jgi:WD40 repeat protein